MQTKKREHIKNKRGKPKREREHTKNKRGKSKRESTQRTRGANLGSGRSAEQSPCEDMVCARAHRERERD